jgi:hypothetical protein
MSTPPQKGVGAERTAAPTPPRAAFPHCDQRILHQPGECSYCDQYAEWQELRTMWGIAFTGHPETGVIPDPADTARPPDSPSDHRQWGGNVARDESDLKPGEWRSYPPLRLNGEDEPEDPHAPIVADSNSLLGKFLMWAAKRTGA